MKKLISLVLFVAMMAMMVPTAAAVHNNAYDLAKKPYDEILELPNQYWYGSQDVEAISGSGDYIGEYGNWDGLKVVYKNDDTTKINVTITGDYSKVEPMSIDGGYTFKKAVRVPVQIKDGDDIIAAEEYVLANGSGLKLVREYGNNEVAWLYMPLVEGGCTASGLVGLVGDTQRVLITVKYVDEDYNYTATKYYDHVTFDIVGYAGAQVNNFRATLVDAKQNTKNVYEPNTLTFNIAALDPQTRADIFNAATTTAEEDVEKLIRYKGLEYKLTEKETMYYFLQADDNMVLKLKAYAPNGTVYPAGTLVEIVNVPYDHTHGNSTTKHGWIDFIGTSNKTVTSDGKAAYYLDANGCFNLEIPGITVFAAGAAGLNAYTIAPFQGRDAVTNLYLIVAAAEKFFDEGMTKVVYEDLIDVVDGSSNYTWAYKWYVGTLDLQFTYGTDADIAGLDIYFQNVEKTSSGISLLGENYTIDLGDTAQIPYIYDDANAMKKELKVGWASVNSSIASVNGDKVTAKKVGTTYLFCTDIEGKVHIINLTVVDPSAPAETPVVTDPNAGYGKYVVTASKLNVRAGEGTSYSKIGSYVRNTVVYGVENPATGWVAIYANGELVGYCSGAYLAEIE